jgi:hypothetical protein
MSAGVRKMPTAMVWPTTNAVADHNPSPPGAEARVTAVLDVMPSRK